MTLFKNSSLVGTWMRLWRAKGKTMKRSLSYLVVIFFTAVCHAGSDKAVDDALKDTQDFLKDRKKREDLFKNDSKAKEADARVQSVTGGDAAASQRIYDISSDAFGAVMQSVGNDPNKMMELLQKAQGNPEAFFNSLPKEVREKIRGVASDIDKKGAAKNSP